MYNQLFTAHMQAKNIELPVATNVLEMCESIRQWWTYSQAFELQFDEHERQAGGYLQPGGAHLS